MSDYEIRIQDKVNPNISKKLDEISVSALKAEAAKKRLEAATNAAASSELKLEASLNRAIAAENAAGVSANKLAKSHFDASVQAQRLATEAQRTAAVQQGAADRSATAAARSAAIQQAADSKTTQNAIVNAARRAAVFQAADDRSKVSAVRAAAVKQAADDRTTQSAIANANRMNNANQKATQQAQLFARTMTSRVNTAISQSRTAFERYRGSVAQADAAQDRAAITALRLARAQEQVAARAATSRRNILGLVRDLSLITGVQLDAGSIVRQLDSLTLLQNKLRVVAKDQMTVNVLTDELAQVSNRTRSPIEETTRAFSRFDMALAGLGASQRQTLRLTETVNKALVLGGANTNEQAAALLQLSQAFNKGKLDGDEFRTVMELMPIAADAIAKQMNVTRGELLKLAPQGKITADILLKAFTAAGVAIDEKFTKTIPTIGQSLTVLSNNFTVVFGRMVEASGVGRSLSEVIIKISENIDILITAAASLAVGLGVAFSLSFLNRVGLATIAMRAFNAAMLANPYVLLATGLAALTAATVLYGDEVQVGQNKLVTMRDVGTAVFDSLIESARDFGKELVFVFDYWKKALKEADDGGFFNPPKSKFDERLMAFTTGNLRPDGTIGSKPTSNSGLGVAGQASSSVLSLFKDVKTFSPNDSNAAPKNTFQGILDEIYKRSEGAAKERLKAEAEYAAKEKKAREDLEKERQRTLATLADVGKTKKGKDVQDLNFAGDGSDVLRAKFVSSMRAMVGLGKEAESCARIVREGAENAGLKFGSTAKAMDGAKYNPAEAGSFFGSDVSEFKKKSQVKPGDLVAFKKTYGNFGEDITHVATISEILADGTMKIIDTSSAAGARIGRAAAVVERTIPSIWLDKIVGYATPKALVGTGKPTDQETAQQKASSSAVDRMVSDSLGLAKFESKAEKAFNKEYQEQFDAAQLKDYNLALQVNQRLFEQGNKTLQQYRASHHSLSEQMADSLLQNSQAVRDKNLQDQMRAVMAQPNQGDRQSGALDILGGLGVDTEALKLNLGIAGQEWQTLYDKIKSLRDSDIENAKLYTGALVQMDQDRETQRLNMAQGFFGNMAALSSSGNKKLAAIGKASAIAQAMIATYQGAAEALKLGPIIGPIMAASVVVAGLANVAQIRAQNVDGFKAGGYTGNMGTSQVAGVVHGQEFVMNAQATQRIGVGNLQALQEGRSVQGIPASGGRNQQAAQPAPIVNVAPPNIIMVSSMQQALSAMKGSEGEAIIMEQIEKNGTTVARLIGAK